MEQVKAAQVAMKAMVGTCYDLVDPPTYDGVGVPQAMNALSSLAATPVDPPTPNPTPPPSGSLPEFSYLRVPTIKQKARLVGGSGGKKKYGTFTPEGM